jgi:hypothetical protein
MSLRIRMDRRSFIGAVVATSVVPLSVVHAMPTGIPLSVSAGAWNGHVDDACGHWPPYSHQIPYGRARTVAQLDGVDHLFLA